MESITKRSWSTANDSIIGHTYTLYIALCSCCQKYTAWNITLCLFFNFLYFYIFCNNFFKQEVKHNINMHSIVFSSIYLWLSNWEFFIGFFFFNKILYGTFLAIVFCAKSVNDIVFKFGKWRKILKLYTEPYTFDKHKTFEIILWYTLDAVKTVEGCQYIFLLFL